VKGARVGEAIAASAAEIDCRQSLVRVACLKLTLLDPQRLRKFGIVSSDLLDEALRVLAADEDLERVTERARGREPVVNDGVHEHEGTVEGLRAAA
jgi:hypothetical protein